MKRYAGTEYCSEDYAVGHDLTLCRCQRCCYLNLFIASPRLDGKILILVDPMLATGASMELSYRALLTKGTPAKIHIASVIASQTAIDYMPCLQ